MHLAVSLLPVALQFSLAQAAPRPMDPLAAKVHDGLLAVPHDETVKVLVEVPFGHEAAVAIAIDALGDDVSVELALRSVVQAWVPVSRLTEVAALDGVQRVRRPRKARKKGSFSKATSEGVAVMDVGDWHDQGLTGKGVDIAVLDTEFKGYEDLLGDELPNKVYTSFYGQYWDYDAHGTAVAEIIHDVAPKAKLSLYQFEDEGQFIQAVDEMIGNGEYLVSASIGFDNVWHADGTSTYAQLVEEFTDEGGLWVGAAGNEAESYWVGTLTDNDGDGWLEFDGAEEIWVYGWDDFGASLRWDDAFGGSNTDIDLYASESSNGDACGAGENYQDGGGDPYEEAWCEGEGGYISAYDYGGGAGTKAWLYAWNGLDEAYLTEWESLTLPADSDAVLAVGAVEHSDESLATYSSRGPTNDGRTKPDVVAPTTVSTASWGQDGFPGTSSATPHVTGVAALILGADRKLQPEDARDWIEDMAVDMGEEGMDDRYGHGLLVVDDPPDGCKRGCSVAPVGAAVVPVFFALVGLFRRRV